MSDIIKLLPDSVANQIAAGEVIQRPASVVKELVENSIDAGASRVQVIIKDAGRTLVQVVDDGKGMSPMDARMAFERHATSKITEAADLFALHTMGFRGEALASIAAVAQIELLTMQPNDKVGTKLMISGSKFEGQEPAAATPGSNLMVKNLFYNVPARRKFLKKDSVELSNIAHEFERLALVNPDVEMSLINNGAVMHQLTRGSLKQRIGGLFGKTVEKQLVPIETETSLAKISGFIGLPENSRKRGALQYFFVNGRNMRHPYFHKAVMHCYEQLIKPDEQPNYFINFEVDPATIDVNIHPTKHEIKFENEQLIWQILVAAIKEALGKFNIAPSIDFNADDSLEIPAFRSGTPSTVDFGLDTGYNPFAETKSKDNGVTGAKSWQKESRQAMSDWDKLYSSFSSQKDDLPDSAGPLSRGQEPDDDNVVASRLKVSSQTVLGIGDTGREEVMPTLQIGGKYLVTQGHGSLLVVNRRRAHIRVLYERMKLFSESAPLPSQAVLFPEVVNMSASRSSVVENNVELLTAAGFDLGYLGDNTWSINGVPAIETGMSAGDLLGLIINDIAEETDIAIENMRQQIALSLAKAGAITSGRVMQQPEIERLLSDLFSLSSPGFTPDGKKIVAELDLQALDELLN